MTSIQNDLVLAAVSVESDWRMAVERNGSGRLHWSTGGLLANLMSPWLSRRRGQVVPYEPPAWTGTRRFLLRSQSRSIASNITVTGVPDSVRTDLDALERYRSYESDPDLQPRNPKFKVANDATRIEPTPGAAGAGDPRTAPTAHGRAISHSSTIRAVAGRQPIRSRPSTSRHRI